MNRDLVYVQHIPYAIGRIDQYVAVGEECSLAETHWQDAVFRQLEIIGEATKRLFPELRTRYPIAAWREAAAMRDILIHRYADVGRSIVWATTQSALPNLKRQIEEILNGNPWE